MREDVRKITDAAMITALIGLLLVIDRQLGFLIDSFLFWVIPIPIVLYVVKYELQAGIVLALSVTLLSFIVSTPDIIVLVAFSAIIGLTYAYGIKKSWPKTWLLFATFIATLIYYVVTMLVFAKFFGYDPVAEAQEIMNYFNNLFANFTSNSSDVIQVLRWFNPFFAMLILFIPFLPIALAFLQTLITHLVSSIVLTRLKMIEVQVTPVFLIRVDKRFGLFSFIMLLLTYSYFIFFNDLKYQSLMMILQFIFQLVFIVSGGIYLLSYAIFTQKQYLSLLVGLAVIFIPIVVMLIGIYDVFSSSRERMIRSAIHEQQTRTN